MRGALLVPGLVVLGLLSGAARGEQPTGGYCIGNMCFAVFEESADFQGAQEVCSRQRGHLMTVRSSVAQDTLSLLLANTSGLFWIGLHLPKGPPDPTNELRGYQWITADTSSDFYNWAGASPTDTTGPRCISVTKSTNFQWEEEACQRQIDGFLCEYTFLDGECASIQNANAFYTTPYGFRVDHAVTLPTGSVAEHPDERKQVCVSGRWLRAPWSCEIQRGGCEHRCTVDPENNPVCYCEPGRTVNPANDLTCEVAVDDPCLKLNCAHACYKYSDSFLCTCREGFALGDDARSCVDLNECSDERQCPDNRKCINTQGWFKCVCGDGYRPDGDRCVDVDECESWPCEHVCDNTPGGYECSCYEGYKVDPESTDKCVLHCGKEECDAKCDPNNKYQCYCPNGYILEERQEHSVCIDIDECEFFLHNCEQHCENAYGGFECFCDRGYTLVDKSKCEKSAHVVVTEAMEVVTVKPTHRPSGVSVGGFVGIIICTVVCILLAVFLINHLLCGKGKTDSPVTLKASECPEANSLQQVTTDTTS